MLVRTTLTLSLAASLVPVALLHRAVATSSRRRLEPHARAGCLGAVPPCTPYRGGACYQHLIGSLGAAHIGM